jgi:hypothetical protein
VVHVPKVVTHTRTSHQHVEQTVEVSGIKTEGEQLAQGVGV